MTIIQREKYSAITDLADTDRVKGRQPVYCHVINIVTASC